MNSNQNGVRVGWEWGEWEYQYGEFIVLWWVNGIFMGYDMIIRNVG